MEQGVQRSDGWAKTSITDVIESTLADGDAGRGAMSS